MADDKNVKYVCCTDKGFLLNRKGVILTGDKKQACQFSHTEVLIYRESIAADLFDFGGCETVQFQPV